MRQTGSEESERKWELYLDERMYQQLRRKATALINCEPAGLSVQGDDLLQDTLLRLLQSRHVPTCQSPDHFRAMVTMRMQQVVIDLVRASKAVKRGRSFQHVPFEESTRGESSSVTQSLIICQAFDRLDARHVRLRRALELRTAGRASLGEIAAELSVSVRTVKRDLADARKWVRQELNLTAPPSQMKGAQLPFPKRIAA